VSEGLDFPAPRPFVHGEEAVYFDYCARGELRLQFCARCRRHIFYPRALCPDCLGDDLEWVAAGGRGVVHTYTVQYRPAGGYRGATPYVVAVVDLEEGVRMLTRIAAPVDQVRIGLPVVLRWARAGDGFQVPVFAPAPEPEAR
jgi:uncharacterized protein